MKRASTIFFSSLFLAAFVSGCGMMMPQQGASPSSQDGSHAPAYTVPKESQDALRKQEQTAYAAVDDAADQELDRMEKDALKALKQALGKEGSGPGAPTPESSSTALKGLQKGKIKVRL